MCDKKIKGTFTNLVEVMMHFDNQETCKEHLERLRWKGEHPTCPACGSENTYILSKRFNYKCANKECAQKIFSVTKGTIFENSPIPLQKWFAAIWLITSHKKGISSLQLHRDLGVTQKSAWFMLQRVRYAMRTKDFRMPMSNGTEVDETLVGGKNKNRHANKKVKNAQGRSLKDKTPVFGLLERNGRIVAMKVKDTKKATLQEIIGQHVQLGSKLYSDEWRAYRGLDGAYRHMIVNHSADQYVIGEAHTNTIEGFWSLLKRGIVGIYHNVSAKHLDAYIDEFEYRYNNREMGESARFNDMLSLSESRLTYNQLTNDRQQKS